MHRIPRLAWMLLGGAVALAPALNGETVGHWRFEEGGGAFANDSSIHDNDGTLAGNTAFVSSVPYPSILGLANNFALTFDGSGDLVSIPDDASLDVTSAFTIEAFVRRTAGIDQTLAGVAVKKNVFGNSAGYGIFFGGADSVRAAAQVASPGSIATANVAISAGVWHHVAAVYNGTTLTLYVDGQNVASVAGSGNVEVSAQPLEIGHFADDFDGEIDEVRVSNVVLTPLEFLRALIFADGFASGNFNAWSSHTP